MHGHPSYILPHIMLLHTLPYLVELRPFRTSKADQQHMYDNHFHGQPSSPSCFTFFPRFPQLAVFLLDIHALELMVHLLLLLALLPLALLGTLKWMPTIIIWLQLQMHSALAQLVPGPSQSVVLQSPAKVSKGKTLGRHIVLLSLFLT